jgi:hypothetical protein
MKKFFLITAVAAMSFAFTGCGDSPDKLVDDIVRDGIKCFKKEYDKAKCDELDKKYDKRKENFTEEELKQIEKKALEKILVEIKKIHDEKKAKKEK